MVSLGDSAGPSRTQTSRQMTGAVLTGTTPGAARAAESPPPWRPPIQPAPSRARPSTAPSLPRQRPPSRLPRTPERLRAFPCARRPSGRSRRGPLAGRRAPLARPVFTHGNKLEVRVENCMYIRATLPDLGRTRKTNRKSVLSSSRALTPTHTW